MAVMNVDDITSRTTQCVCVRALRTRTMLKNSLQRIVAEAAELSPDKAALWHRWPIRSPDANSHIGGLEARDRVAVRRVTSEYFGGSRASRAVTKIPRRPQENATNHILEV